MKVLFISRKFPPQIGGMEEHAFQLLGHLSVDVFPILLKKSPLHLIWFLPFAFFKSLFIARKVDVIYLADGLLAPIGILLRFLFHKPVVATIHGLDFTYPNPVYQYVNVRALRNLDGVIAVSAQTKREAIMYHIPEQRISIISNGVDPEKFRKNIDTHFDLSAYLGMDTQGKRVLTTVGRLIRRKGVHWFVTSVMPLLPRDVIYLIIGTGPDAATIRSAAREHHLEGRIFLLGKLDNDSIGNIFSKTDIFLMPNISVKGDREGFGIVALEAAAYGLPVLASDIEGIPEAIHDGRNGFLVQSGDPHAFCDRIIHLITDPAIRKDFGVKAREYSMQYFNWQRAARAYEEVFRKII